MQSQTHCQNQLLEGWLIVHVVGWWVRVDTGEHGENSSRHGMKGLRGVGICCEYMDTELLSVKPIFEQVYLRPGHTNVGSCL